MCFMGTTVWGNRRVVLAAAKVVFWSSGRPLIMKTRSHEDRVAQEGFHDGMLVVLVEDAEFADIELIKFLNDGLETNRDSTFILAMDADINATCTLAERESGGGRQKRRDEVSSNGLDVSIRADDDVGGLSFISSDLTREITMELPHTSSTLLKRIKKCVALNRGPEQSRETREALLVVFERAFNEAGGDNEFEVDEEVLEHVLRGMEICTSRACLGNG
ncbi:hypothetical protein SASPL_137253 [Salvia splendens]|uniref:Uncharacterized protein n=1 Tax=Salvia splendens TaxID=180675 RepID=A0A8X8ZCS6_SALSN|nr:hypothetical protein SASPL_137253 [Salvia splendens]